MKISVVGTGYVGLVTGTCFAETGNEVTCIDIDIAKVRMMKDGKIPIYEPGLEKIFKRNIKEERLIFTSDLKSGIKDAEVIFLALPTPPGEDGSADLSYIMDVAKKIGPYLNKYTIVIDKSTVPVGTAEKVNECIESTTTVEFDVVSNPEFLREGFAVDDFMKPDRVVIGTSSDKAKKVLQKLYSPFVKQGNPIYFMDEKSAEMTKYVANSFLATKISFMNEVANLCEIFGANVDDVRLGIGSDERIGKRFLFPGIGYGGSCFPKDVMALQKSSSNMGYDFKILNSVSEVNKIQKLVLTKKMMKYYEDNVNGKTFAVWGLSFKPDTDDIREAPALEIINDLISNGAKVNVFDPEAMPNVKKLMKDSKNIQYFDNEYDLLEDCDALIIATEWSEFKSPDFNKIKKLLKKPVIFDGRNLFNNDDMRGKGLYYESIGREIIND
jgi:UDPglucose 6-dehydrogenase